MIRNRQKILFNLERAWLVEAAIMQDYNLSGRRGTNLAAETWDELARVCIEPI